MRRLEKIEVLGDSILKGIQLDAETGKYVVRNEMDEEGLARRFGLTIHNHSHFGCTAEKASRLLERMLERGLSCDAVVMDFGGNDCDYKWPEIAAHPEQPHFPAYGVERFTEIYRAMVRGLKAREILPILTTLPPLEPRRFLDWWCRDADESAVLRWMGGSACNVYAHQEKYSRAVERLAREESVPLVDLWGAFLEDGHLDATICMDGTHPNSAGQTLIARTFAEFAEERRRLEAAAV